MDATVKELEPITNDSFIINSINFNLSKAVFNWLAITFYN